MRFFESFLNEIEKIAWQAPPKRTFPEQAGMPWAKMSPRFGGYKGKPKEAEKIRTEEEKK